MRSASRCLLLQPLGTPQPAMCPRAVALSFLFALISAVANGDPSQGVSLPEPCLPGRPCTLALISDNPVTLRCPGAPHQGPVSWQYVDPSRPGERPATFIRTGHPLALIPTRAKLWQLRLKTRLLRGDLRILDPGVEDSGIYTCRRGDTMLAYYEVDFQDAGRLHISHASLGEAALANTTVELAGGARGQLFTTWARWQPCDRCGGPGERKRVGFCYARLASRPQGPLPCGLAGRGLPQRGPELRVESCEVPCDRAYTPSRDEWGKAPILVITRYRALPHASARLRCPTASIYRYKEPCHAGETQGPMQLCIPTLHPRIRPMGPSTLVSGPLLATPGQSHGPTSAGIPTPSQIRPMVPPQLVFPPHPRSDPWAAYLEQYPPPHPKNLSPSQELRSVAESGPNVRG
uniref:Ig-like domain-containing protein n=1 Tax=Terrapene triunguis TaxID=2587831 RepID=A0A674JNR0_9SAUR